MTLPLSSTIDTVAHNAVISVPLCWTLKLLVRTLFPLKYAKIKTWDLNQLSNLIPTATQHYTSVESTRDEQQKFHVTIILSG